MRVIFLIVLMLLSFKSFSQNFSGTIKGTISVNILLETIESN